MSDTMATAIPLGYSYIRFSGKQQEKGDSLRRQTDGAAAWCEKNKVGLDETTTLRDLGVSAFRGKHRKNAETHALAGFLKLAEDGRIPEGSYLIIENLDRLTREHLRAAVTLFLQIQEHGIHIVTTSPERVFRHDSTDMTDLIIAVVELARGHSESRTKSDRLSEAWGQKKDEARASRSIQTTRVPAWLDVVGRVREGRHMKGGQFRLIPERAELVKRLFDMAVSGHGLYHIVKRLTAKGIEPWGRGQAWSKGYVHKILSERTVLGEYQPRRGAKAEGDPVPGYYPAVPGVDEDLWQRAQTALAQRKQRPGRLGDKVASLFSGLLVEARTGDKLRVAWQRTGPQSGKRANGKDRTGVRRRVLIPAASMEGRMPMRSFPYQVFEDAVLSKLREVNPDDVAGDQPPGDAARLAAELANVETRLRAIQEELTGDGDVPTLIKAARTLEARRVKLQAELAEAQHRERNPLGAAWGEARTLLDLATDEETRLRLRSLLRQTVGEIRVLVVPHRSHRFAAVQIHFRGGTRRDYLIHYWSAGYCREGGWEPRSTNWPTLDLRNPDHVAQLESALLADPLTFESQT